MRQRAPQKAGGTRQRRHGLGRVFLAGEMREMHGRVRQIGGNVDLRHRDTTHARVFDLVDKEITQLALNLIRHALCALRVPLHAASIKRSEQPRAPQLPNEGPQRVPRQYMDVRRGASEDTVALPRQTLTRVERVLSKAAFAPKRSGRAVALQGARYFDDLVHLEM